MNSPSPLHFQFARLGDTHNLRLCLRNNPALTYAYSPDSQSTLLYNAVMSGKLDCVRMLVEEFGADVHQTSTAYGNSSLHIAVWYGLADIVQYLLGRGATARPNTFGEVPFDQLSKPCPERSPEAAQRTLQVMREYLAASGGGATNATTTTQQQQPSTVMRPADTAGQQQQQQQQPNPTATTGIVLPANLEEVRRRFPRLFWSTTGADYVAKGLLPYTYRNVEYYTPIVFLCAKQVTDAVTATMMYRSLIDMNNLNGLTLSSKAVYLEFVSGAVKPQPPFFYASASEYLVHVAELFQKIPPLVDSSAPMAVRPLSCVSADRRILIELSAFCDGALQYRPLSHTVEGVIPVFPSNSKTFKPLACVPIRITLVHMTHGNSTLPPLVFVCPLDADMVLMGTSCVDGTTGQVKNLPSLVTWTAQSSLTKLLQEIQESFTTALPIASPSSPSTSPLIGTALTTSNNVSTSTTAAAAAAAEVVAGSSSSSPTMNANLNNNNNNNSNNSTGGGSDIADALLCVICMSEAKRFIALPCRHLLFCSSCVEAFARQNKKDCPICRAKVADLFEIYT